MARRFSDSFSGYYNTSTWQEYYPYSITPDAITIASGGGRWGNDCMAFNAGGGAASGVLLLINPILGNTVTAGGAFNLISTQSNQSPFTFVSPGNQTIYTLVNNIGQVGFYNNSGQIGTLSAVGAVTPSVWHFLEMQVLFAGTSIGTLTFKVDGDVVLTLTGIQTASSGTTSYVNQVWTGCSVIGVGNGNGYFSINDAYVNDNVDDGSGSTGFDGDQRMYPVIISGAGQSTEMTPNTGTNYAAVIDATGCDQDTTYVQAATVDLIDLYVQAGVPTTAISIKCLDMVAFVAKDDAGVAAAQFTFGDGTNVELQGEDMYAPTGATYSMFRKQVPFNPWNSAAWVYANFNTSVNSGGPLQIGIKRTQ